MAYTPGTERIQSLHTRLSPAYWEKRIKRAKYRLSIVEALRERHPTGRLSRAGVAEVAAGVSWGNARRWWAWYHNREGEPLERMIDRRNPGKSREAPADWKSAVRILGRRRPSPTLEEIRAALVQEFGPEAALSDSTLRRILRDSGLQGHRAPQEEEVTELSGGGGLVLLLSAMIETDELPHMSEAVTALAQAAPEPAGAVSAEPGGRDGQGRFTASYNRKRLAAADEHGLQQSIDEQRPHKDLTRSRLAGMSSGTLEQHLRCLTALPLLTERRGMAGLNGPAGAWLEILSPTAYKAATLERTLNELKWLGAAEIMWDSHAQTWLILSQKWAVEPWMQAAFYVDATQDPWWTQRFAKSGKVSRTGRVQPCLTRTVLSGGPGVPIIAEVTSGQADLGEQMLNMINMSDTVLGKSALSRITVVDAECCERAILRRFADDPEHDVVTVLKGPLAVGKTLENPGEWQAYRERDRLREADVELGTKGDELRLRVVEMERPDSRNPKTTRFITTAERERLSTQAVADLYLSRWPFMEDLFRRGRNGIGLERSDGYGVTKTTHLAIVDKRQAAEQKLQRAVETSEQLKQAENRAQQQLNEAQIHLEERKKTEELNGRHKIGVRLAKQKLKECRQACHKAEKAESAAEKEAQKYRSMPDDIYVRDTALDAVTTCLKMALLALLEFICQEYLGQYRLMPRTFIESWMLLPVTIRRQRHCIIYEVAPNARDPAMTRILEKALERITARKLRADGRLLVARMRDGPSMDQIE